MISKNKIAIFFFISLLMGVFIQNIATNIYLSTLVLLFIAVLFLIYYIISKRFLILILFSILGIIIGIGISEYNLIKINNKEEILNKYYDNNKYDLIFEIKDTYKKNDDYVEYIASINQIGNIKINKNILSILRVGVNSNFDKGYIIKTNTKLYKIQNFNDFEYKKYMLSKNIYFKSNVYNFEIINKIELNAIEKNIIKLRKILLNAINQIYPKEEAIFLGGILIGARENLPTELKQDFNNSGLTHFIAVSGSNITILIIFLTFILKYFPVWFRIISITIAITFFTILVGDTAPVIRASIMGLIGYYILMYGRKADVLIIILLTATIMAIISPFALNYDISLHLSFLAVLGIIYTQDFFSKIFHFLPDTLEIKTAFVLTLSALSFSLPIMIFNFGQVSILAPFSNIAVTWTIPLAMLLGFLSIIVYLVYPFVGIVIGYITWIFLKWDIIVVHFFGNLDWSLLKFNFGIYKTHLEIIYFIILLFLIIRFRKKEPTN